MSEEQCAYCKWSSSDEVYDPVTGDESWWYDCGNKDAHKDESFDDYHWGDKPCPYYCKG